MFLLRVLLPDRPGSLGAVATALGDAHADISAVEIVERLDGAAIDDFMLTLPPDARPDALLTACAGLEGVEVMWVSSYPDHWGLTADTDVLDRMVTDPAHAERILMDAAPAAFHGTWAVVAEPDGRVREASDLAPPEPRFPLSLVGDLSVAHTTTWPAGFVDGWGEHAIAAAPFRDGHAIVVGRPGPDFRRSELARLKHLAMLAGDHDLPHRAPGGDGQKPRSWR